MSLAGPGCEFVDRLTKEQVDQFLSFKNRSDYTDYFYIDGPDYIPHISAIKEGVKEYMKTTFGIILRFC